jgi:hypothetical protein
MYERRMADALIRLATAPPSAASEAVEEDKPVTDFEAPA